MRPHVRRLCAVKLIVARSASRKLGATRRMRRARLVLPPARLLASSGATCVSPPARSTSCVKRGAMIVIAEVKTRQSLIAGEGHEAVNRVKRERMIRLGDQYAALHPEVRLRYDILSLFWTRLPLHRRRTTRMRSAHCRGCDLARAMASCARDHGDVLECGGGCRSFVATRPHDDKRQRLRSNWRCGSRASSLCRRSSASSRAVLGQAFRNARHITFVFTFAASSYCAASFAARLASASAALGIRAPGTRPTLRRSPSSNAALKSPSTMARRASARRSSAVSSHRQPLARVVLAQAVGKIEQEQSARGDRVDLARFLVRQRSRRWISASARAAAVRELVEIGLPRDRSSSSPWPRCTPSPRARAPLRGASPRRRMTIARPRFQVRRSTPPRYRTPRRRRTPAAPRARAPPRPRDASESACGSRDTPRTCPRPRPRPTPAPLRRRRAAPSCFSSASAARPCARTPPAIARRTAPATPRTRAPRRGGASRFFSSARCTTASIPPAGRASGRPPGTCAAPR